MAAVLLIEDDASQRFVAAFALKAAGHEVREAADGFEGLAAARARKPDVIVCDVMMPGLTGYEVVTALRTDADLAAVPVVLLTAMSDRKHMRQGMTSGADDYLTKPYKPAELCEAVTSALERRQTQQHAFMNSVSGVVSSALEEQKEALGRKFEDQLMREINARWASRANDAGDIAYPNAILLLVDFLGSAARVQGENDLAELTRQAHQSARDTLYLFGASHVLPYAGDLLAVFDANEASHTTPVESRVMRAALALVKAAPPDRGISLAVHAGPITLISMHDGLHNERGHAIVPGDTVACVAALRETGRHAGWRIAASPTLAKAFGQHVSIGAKATTHRGEEAVEIRSTRPA
jgi:DNA-binding response OmpR family regulator